MAVFFLHLYSYRRVVWLVRARGVTIVSTVVVGYGAIRSKLSFFGYVRVGELPVCGSVQLGHASYESHRIVIVAPPDRGGLRVPFFGFELFCGSFCSFDGFVEDYCKTSSWGTRKPVWSINVVEGPREVSVICASPFVDAISGLSHPVVDASGL